MKYLGDKREAQRGATVVEYAIVAPLLFLLLFGVVEFGRAIATYTAASTAAREGARYATAVGESAYTSGLARYVDCDGIEQAARAKAVVLDQANTTVEVHYDSGPMPGHPDPAPTATCGGATPPTEGTVTSGGRVIVRVETEFSSPIPLISNLTGPLQINSEQARTIFKGEVRG